MADEGQGTNNGKAKDESNFIMGFKGVDEFSQEGIKRVIEATRAFQALPSPGPLWDLQKSYPEFSRAMRNSRTRILPIMKTLLEHAKISTHDFKRRDLEEKFDFIVESNDDILERIASALDDASGLSTRTEILVVNPTPKASKPPGIWGKRKPIDASADSMDATATGQAEKIRKFPTSERGPVKKAFYRLKVTEKPQINFKVPIDNSLTPFIPKLKDKPNSLKPLSILPEYNGKNEEFYGHPYQVELNRWVADPSHMVKVNPQIPAKLGKKSYTLVQTQKDLEGLLEEFRKVDVIAVDVEHHSYRTFLGITCTIQLSTRSSDYVIDAIALREELGCLNEVFTKSKIIKVFHGASSDIEWLQRDCGLYIVGMFDTYVASKQLGNQQLSLQYLLTKYCQVSVDKSYQLADWRIRPLPEDMLYYAAQDTHYLLYIYDMMKNELIDAGNQLNNLLTAVYDESNMICLKRYEKPTVNPQLTLRKTRRVLNNRQLYAFTEIFKWRDMTAREKDESLGYILPNHMLFMVSETLPKEMTGILACCDPVPPLVHVNLGLLHRIVLKARDLPLHEEKIQLGVAEKRKKLKNWIVIMNSIHDIEADIPEDQNGTPVTERDTDPGSKTWPEPWTSPVDMSDVKVRSQSALPFGQRERRNFGIPTRTIKENNIRSLSNAFERYELSCQIMEMLKDPKRKDTLDMKDPTVRVVYDTLYRDPAEEYKASMKNLTVINNEPANILPKRDFVPFNPIAEFMKQQQIENRKSKKKQPKHEPWDADNPPNISTSSIKGRIADSLEAGIGLEDDEVDSDQNQKAESFVHLPKSKSEHRRDKKKNKNRSESKVLDKLKFWKKKRKYEVDVEQGQLDGDDIVCLNPPNEPSPAKRFKDIQAERFPAPNTSSGNNNRGRNGQGKRRSDNRGRGNKRGGFFNAFRRPEGRSVTYK